MSDMSNLSYVNIFRADVIYIYTWLRLCIIQNISIFQIFYGFLAWNINFNLFPIAKEKLKETSFPFQLALSK